jgi:hypothetical protein
MTPQQARDWATIARAAILGCELLNPSTRRRTDLSPGPAGGIPIPHSYVPRESAENPFPVLVWLQWWRAMSVGTLDSLRWSALPSVGVCKAMCLVGFAVAYRSRRNKRQISGRML